VISERIKIARNKRKLTQEELAKKVNTTKGTISNYENEYSKPSPEMIKDIADALDVDTDYLVGRTNVLKREENISSAFHDFDNLTEEEKEWLDIQLDIFRKKMGAKKKK
jgi:transcriptional regulator with XRE-family HTH domain